MASDLVELTTKHGDPIKLQKVGDDILAHFPLSEEKLASIEVQEYLPTDIVLCTYPKSGTHWVANLIKKMLVRKMEETSKKEFSDQLLGLLEITASDRLAKAVQPRLVGTHLPPKRLPTYFREGKAKLVVLFRNPKDVAVSMYYHLRNAVSVSNKQDWNEFLESFISGVVPFKNVLDYFKNWEVELKTNGSLDVEYFYFEDLKTNGLENVRRLAKHLNVDLDDTELQTVLDECSLKSLKEEDDKADNEIKRLLADKNGNSIIWRKGEVGDWKNHFTVAQNEMYDNMIGEALQGGMFKFKFE